MGNNTVINTRFTKTEITPYDVKYLIPAHILLNEPELNKRLNINAQDQL